MTLLAIVALAGLGVAGLEASVLFYLTRKLVAAEARTRERLEEALRLKLRVDELSRAVDDRDRALADLEADRKGEEAARRVTEKQRDDLIQKLASIGDPGGVAAAVRNELRLLASLSRSASPPAPEGGGDEGAVHGPAPGP